MDTDNNPQCPHCKVRFILNLPALGGDIVSCHECGELVEIVQIQPLVVDILEDPLISSRRVFYRQQF